MISLVIAGMLLKPRDPALQTFTSPLLLEFAVGLAVSQMAFLRGFWVGLGLFFGGAVLLVVIAMVGVDQDQTVYRPIDLGIPACALVSGALALERTKQWPRLKFLEGVGDASYSLYLSQGLVIAFDRKFLHPPTVLHLPLVIGLSLAVATTCYRLFELPVARLLRRLVAAPQTTAISSRRSTPDRAC